MQDEELRTELANFLQTCRAWILPAQVGLPNSARRRTPGLRREEVAQLTNVSVEWYTRLEQGRDIRVSRKTLGNLARALSLNADECVHLFHLAGQEPPPSQHAVDEEVSPSLQRFLDAQGTNPAYVVGKRWDRLAWNAAACAVFDDFPALSPCERKSCGPCLSIQRVVVYT
jgi:transcriptional regulator with XRE-family HTH domain